VRRRGFSGRMLMLAAVVALAGCSNSSGVHLESNPSPTSTTRPISSGVPASSAPVSTMNPQARAAVAAYEGMSAAYAAAQREPVKQGEAFPEAADITRWTFDPFRNQSRVTIWSLAAKNIQFRGTPATLHVQVKGVYPKASPWPKVILSNCPTGGDWHPYNTKTNAEVPEVTPAVPLPHRATITVIYFQKRWGVSSVTFDPSRTCSA